MRSPLPEALGAAGPSRRCRCGHYPTSHMRCLPIDPSRPDGGYRLAPVGPCHECGESTCGAYSHAP